MAKTKEQPRYELHAGDASNLLPAKIPAGTVDLAVCDFPYNYGMEYNGYKDKLPFDVYLDWNKQMLRAVMATLKPTGALWVFYPDEWVSDIDVIARHGLGLHRQSWVIWGFGFGVCCTGRFSRGHTHILHYTRHKTRHTFNAAAVAVPSDRQALYNDKRAAPGGKTPNNVWVLQQAEMNKVLPPDGDLWYQSRICGSFKERKTHCPNQIPVSLLSRIILATSNPGDLVIDPCSGTFSTGEAALRHGRRFVGFDIDKASVTEGEKRLKLVASGADPSGHLGLFDPPVKSKRKIKSTTPTLKHRGL